MGECRSRLLMLALPALLLGCAQEENDDQDTQPTATEVSVIEVQAAPVDVFLDLPGRVEAVAVAEVRARVDGIVEERLYREGTDVQAGQTLFRIDPREMEAALGAAQAELSSARANAANAVRDARRYEELVERGAISRQDRDTAVARRRTAEAEVARAEAAVEGAHLQLGYTEVVSPIDGVAGRAEVTVGALVSASAATLLTRVEQFDPVYVDLAQSSTDLLALRAEVASGELQLPEDKRIEVRLTLEDGQPYPHTGHLDFFSMSIDRDTGTLALRAEVPNPDRILLPGQFVRTRLHAGVRPDAIRVPQRALVMDQAGASVFLVDRENRVVPRPVELGAMRDGYWVVQQGLEPSERIIVEGWDGLRPGQTVRAVPHVDEDEQAPLE